MSQHWSAGRRDTATDRLAAQVARQLDAQRGSVSRRNVLRSAGLSALALSGGGLLTACGTSGTQQTAETCQSTDKSSAEKTLNFSNWPLYIDEKGKRLPTLQDFEAESGIAVTYNTDVNDNNQFFAKVRNQLGACESTGRDIFVLTDWMASRVISLGWTQDLDMANMPNVDANLVESLRNPSWDPGRKNSVPWQSGLTGIAYNEKFTGPVSSFEELVTRADLKGKITLLSELNDTMGFMLKLVDADPNDFSEDEWAAALARLEEIVASGQVRQFTGNDYTRGLGNGDIVACEAWSGDVIALQYDQPEVKFVKPTEGLSLWSDNMMVPIQAEHRANAESLMNYYYEPEVAARLAAWVNYICPVQGAEDAMAEVDGSLVGNPLIFPSDEDLAQTFALKSVESKIRERYDKEFNQVIGA